MSVAPRQLLAYRYFFALLPDEFTARRIHAFAERTFGEKGLMRAERLHVTLAITADFPARDEAPVEALLGAGDSVLAAPFDLVLDRLGGGRRTSALRPAHSLRPLAALQADIAKAMAQAGVAMRPAWDFSPHLTLVYRDGEPVQRPVENFGWAVREFALVESLVGLTRHHVLRRWPLAASEDPQLGLFPK